MGEHAHFEGKEALEHVIDAHTQGIVTSSEIHGTEIPGPISAGADAARETAQAVLLLWLLLTALGASQPDILLLLAAFSTGWVIWKTGRSAWLGWSRLERLHRIVAEEKWEIEHHRQQEREELSVLYAAKGFQGKLLEDVLDVLMADGDRLLKVMLEEEMGMSIETHEHPLKQSLGAFIGAFAAVVISGAAYLVSSDFGIICSSFLVIAIASMVSAKFEKNRLIAAVVWNLGLSIFSVGSVYFLLELILR